MLVISLATTVTVSVPETPSQDAVMIAVPVVLLAVTRPVAGSTKAIALLLLDHATTWVRSSLVPSEESPVAAVCCLGPSHGLPGGGGGAPAARGGGAAGEMVIVFRAAGVTVRLI